MSAGIAEEPASRTRRTTPGARRTWDGVDVSAAAHAVRLRESQLGRLRRILQDDILSEYDARFFSAYVRSLDVPFTDAFWELEQQWADDERRHYRVTRATYERLFGWSERERATLAGRAADFGPLEPLFTDEFSIACLGAYDELATVRAYRANLPHYDRLGPEYGRFLRAVIADEAWHYSGFLDLIRRYHTHRLPEARGVVERIRSCEGTPYGNTFVLDHDDPVFTDEIVDQSTRVLLRQLGRTESGKNLTPITVRR